MVDVDLATTVATTLGRDPRQKSICDVASPVVTKEQSKKSRAVLSQNGCYLFKLFSFLFFSWRPEGCGPKPMPPGFHTTTREPKRAHLRVPALQKTPPKFHEKTPREGRIERILRREREKRAKFWAVQGKGGPGWEGRSGEGRSRGTEHDQTKTLKPTHTRETPHHETVKPAPTPHSTHNTHKHTHTKTHKHTTHHTQHTTHKKSNSIWPNSVWPTSVSSMLKRSAASSLPTGCNQHLPRKTPTPRVHVVGKS